MRPILRIVSLVSLIAVILPPVLFLAGRLELDKVKLYMLLATIVWFVTASPVMWKDNGQPAQEETAAP